MRSSLPHRHLRSVWQLIRLTKDFETYLSYRQRAEGDIFEVKAYGVTPYMVVADPDIVAGFYAQSSENLSDYPANQYAEPVFGRESTIFQEGPRHRADRALFLDLLRTVDFSIFQNRLRSEVIARVEEGREMGGVDLFDCFRKSYRRAAANYLFGERDLDRFEHLADVLLQRHGSLASLFTRDLSRRRTGEARLGLTRKAISRWIEERGERGLNKGVENSVMSAMIERGRDNWPLLSDQLFTLFLTIYIPPAATAAWSLARLLELDRERGDSNEWLYSRIRVEDCSGFLDAIFFETLRWHNPLPFTTRFVQKDFEAGGHSWKSGTRLLLASFLMHHDSRFWENPNDFDWTRFEKRSESLDSNAFIPFGGGSYRCLGRHLAMPLNALALRSFLETAEGTVLNSRTEIYPGRYLAGARIPAGGLRVEFR